MTIALDVLAAPDDGDRPGDALTTADAYRLFAQTVTLTPRARERARWNALALRAQAGDRAARDTLYLKARQWLLHLAEPAIRTVRAAAHPGLEPDDVRQELFLIYCDLLASWEPARGPFAGYVGVLLPHRLRHYVRRMRWPDRVPFPVTADLDDDPNPAALLRDPRPDPAAVAAAAVDGAALLALLDPPARRLVRLYAIDGQPMPVVARRLDVSRRTAWRLWAAARAVLLEGVLEEMGES
ncbi:MAG TPA: hypothetical protein VM536_19145 [Chloroflexia bacterium]|nr:hypothetical protein [Chloroflexia bacterium]